jgi:hypothetical protein
LRTAQTTARSTAAEDNKNRGRLSTQVLNQITAVLPVPHSLKEPFAKIDGMDIYGQSAETVRFPGDCFEITFGKE